MGLDNFDSFNWRYGLAYERKKECRETTEFSRNHPILSFASAIWFWMTPQFPKPSCHDIMAGNWKPTDNETKKGCVHGFGATVNVINGGIECGNGIEIEKTSYRYQYYQYFCKYFNISPGENIDCSNQKPFGQ